MTNLRKQDVVPPRPSYRLIPLTRGDYAIVDAADYDWLNQSKWSGTAAGYAVRRVNRKIIHMHRLILGLTGKINGDHWNGDTRDNRRINLRRRTQWRNSQNAKVGRNNTSGCTGVFDMKNGLYHAFITPRGGKRKNWYFHSYEEAVAARKAAEKRYYGEVIRETCPPRIIVTPKMLRAAIRGQRVNSTSGLTGISLHRKSGKWMARVFMDKTTHYLGLYTSKKLANTARKSFLLEKRGQGSPW